MNRRDLLKTAIFVPLLSKIGMSNVIEPTVRKIPTELKPTYVLSDGLEKIFETLESEGPIAEFPLDLLYPPTRGCTCYTRPETHNNVDYVTIPLNLCGNINDDALKLLVYASLQRNIICYDNKENNRIISKRLLAVMTTVMRRASTGYPRKSHIHKLSDIIIDKSAQVSNDTLSLASKLSITIHKMDLDYIEYYKGLLPNQKSSLVIGIDRNYNLLAATHKEKYGLAVLDNTSLILGAI